MLYNALKFVFILHQTIEIDPRKGRHKDGTKATLEPFSMCQGHRPKGPIKSAEISQRFGGVGEKLLVRCKALDTLIMPSRFEGEKERLSRAERGGGLG